MASITWPTLPAPLSDGYGESIPDSTIRTSMDTGPAKMRRRFTAAPRPFSLRYHLTAAEIATLDTFYVATARSGSLRFNWNHPRTGSACEARFLSAPRYSAVEAEGEAYVELEVLP